MPSIRPSPTRAPRAHRAARTILPLAALLAAAGACGAASPAGPSGPDAPGESPSADVSTASVEKDGLVATLKLSPSSVRSGGAFTVRFALVNRSRKTVQVTLTCTAPAYLALRAASGGDALNSSGCGQAITTRTLAPNGEVAMSLPWRAEASGYPSGQPLPAGRYVLEAAPTVSHVDGQALTLAPLRAELRVR
ncbi:hypothetical protein [Roseisolibacter agri]|uniref:Intracellular proteinase inhibitor BsuPI domain-containing protein n=1 Tax=Roseisolibacter agri TaxID=2014610 RepID=A0AA37QKE6_9BACT|nr:hypothetical protein [Roseisolibacter agri]GLC28533.1 hypothetical protein rosag_50460 [Roseisolibacter agri]